MNSRLISWIWHVRGSLALAPGLSSNDAFERLAPLFQQIGTSHTRAGDSLTFHKKGAAAQDKMAVFDRGFLQVERRPVGSVLHYHLTSRALLFCFLAPLLFLGFAQLTVMAGKLDNSSAQSADKSKGALKVKKKLEEAKLIQNPIDKALGSPAPEKKKDDDKKKKASPTAAFIFSGIFAALYGIGRVLESRTVASLFRKKLQDQTV